MRECICKGMASLSYACFCMSSQGHRTLVFSQSRVMLDILQRACRARRFQCLRLDGSVASSADRAVNVQQRFSFHTTLCQDCCYQASAKDTTESNLQQKLIPKWEDMSASASNACAWTSIASSADPAVSDEPKVIFTASGSCTKGQYLSRDARSFLAR